MSVASTSRFDVRRKIKWSFRNSYFDARQLGQLYSILAPHVHIVAGYHRFDDAGSQSTNREPSRSLSKSGKIAGSGANQSFWRDYHWGWGGGRRRIRRHQGRFSLFNRSRRSAKVIRSRLNPPAPEQNQNVK